MYTVTLNDAADSSNDQLTNSKIRGSILTVAGGVILMDFDR